MDETTTLAGMLLGALGILAGTVTYLFRLLVTKSERARAELIATYEARLAERDREIARLTEAVERRDDGG